MSALSDALKVSASTWADLDAIARQAGITPRQASMARAGKQIHAGAHLALCATIGIDPIDGKMRPVKVLSPNVVWWLLSGELYITRSLKKLDQRAAAKLIGVSPVSVCRTERGQPVSIEVLLKVYVFIGIRPDAYTAPLTAPPQIVPRRTSTETFCFGSERLPDNVGSANQATAP